LSDFHLFSSSGDEKRAASAWQTFVHEHVKQPGMKNPWNTFGAGTPTPAEEAAWRRRCELLASASGSDLYTKIQLPVQKKPETCPLTGWH
jgi:hypothetical protein